MLDLFINRIREIKFQLQNFENLIYDFSTNKYTHNTNSRGNPIRKEVNTASNTVHKRNISTH
jgi:hypothetical protein